MRMRAAPGEIILGLALVGVGAFWIITALKLPLWEGFAPSSGFLPLIYGVLLIGLSIAAVLLEAHGGGDSEPAGTIQRPLLVIATLVAGVAGLERAGFAVSMFLTMFFLVKFAERRAFLPSLLLAGISSAVLTLVFRTWLGVPLPKGPWGF